MNGSKFGILGGGMVAGYAAKQLVELGLRPGELTILSADSSVPYERPPLSKGFLAGTDSEETIRINAEDFYRKNGIELKLKCEISAVDTQRRRLILKSAGEFEFNKLLVATGARPRKLNIPGANLQNLCYLRTLEDSKANKEAISMLEQAVGMDPSYAPAWAALGLRYYYDAHYGGGGREMYQRSESAYERALALDPNLMLAAGQLTTARADSGDLRRAYQQAQALLKSRPDSGEVHLTLAYVLRYAGLLDESAHECDTALRLDPGNYQFRTCALPFMQMGNTERARDFVNLDAGSEWSNYLMAGILMREGKLNAAQEIVQRLSSNPYYHRNLLQVCLQHGSGAELDRLAREVESTTSEIPDPEPRFFRGTILAFCGEQEIGLRMLEAAISHNHCGYQALQTDPLLAKVRGSHEFRQLLPAAKGCQDKFLSERQRDSSAIRQ